MPVVIEMDQYGGPEVLEPRERPRLRPGPGEALVRVMVAGVNRADLFIRSGEWPQAGGWPYVPGLELAGEIEEVGPDVQDFAPGDRVITMMQRLGGIHGERPGGYQELARVPARTLARVPAELDLATAGALGLPAVTAFRALDVLQLRPDTRLLVHGGSSAVGSMAIQLARARGVEQVLASSTHPDKFPFLAASGATQTIDTSKPDWPEQTGPIDRVLDLVGEAVFARSVDLLRSRGRLVFAGGTSGADLSLSGWALMRPVTISGWSSETLTRSELQQTVDALAELSAERKLRLIRLSCYPLSEAASAHADIEAGRLAGRVILRPGGSDHR